MQQDNTTTTKNNNDNEPEPLGLHSLPNEIWYLMLTFLTDKKDKFNFVRCSKYYYFLSFPLRVRGIRFPRDLERVEWVISLFFGDDGRKKEGLLAPVRHCVRSITIDVWNIVDVPDFLPYAARFSPLPPSSSNITSLKISIYYTAYFEYNLFAGLPPLFKSTLPFYDNLTYLDIELVGMTRINGHPRRSRYLDGPGRTCWMFDDASDEMWDIPESDSDSSIIMFSTQEGEQQGEEEEEEEEEEEGEGGADRAHRPPRIRTIKPEPTLSELHDYRLSRLSPKERPIIGPFIFNKDYTYLISDTVHLPKALRTFRFRTGGLWHHSFLIPIKLCDSIESLALEGVDPSSFWKDSNEKKVEEEEEEQEKPPAFWGEEPPVFPRITSLTLSLFDRAKNLDSTFSILFPNITLLKIIITTNEFARLPDIWITDLPDFRYLKHLYMPWPLNNYESAGMKIKDMSPEIEEWLGGGEEWRGRRGKLPALTTIKLKGPLEIERSTERFVEKEACCTISRIPKSNFNSKTEDNNDNNNETGISLSWTGDLIPPKDPDGLDDYSGYSSEASDTQEGNTAFQPFTNHVAEGEDSDDVADTDNDAVSSSPSSDEDDNKYTRKYNPLPRITNNPQAPYPNWGPSQIEEDEDEEEREREREREREQREDDIYPEDPTEYIPLSQPDDDDTQQTIDDYESKMEMQPELDVSCNNPYRTQYEEQEEYDEYYEGEDERIGDQIEGGQLNSQHLRLDSQGYPIYPGSSYN
ncbi:hypothetical protein TWF730_009408 [Orbilia blumenaviensis]|uniref:F-box domain-containing protein n=1 Tax=Orbilia blumenaviensis TaxID=1796055 RepID=A0AAV9V0I0_9PEZI